MIRVLDKIEGRRFPVAYRVFAARIDRYRLLPDLHGVMFQKMAKGS